MPPAEEEVAATNLERVENWNIDAPKSEERSVVSRLANECVVVFRRATMQLRLIPDVPNAIYRCYEKNSSSLALWDAGYGVSEGKLDELVAQSRTLRSLVLETLISISTSLTDALLPLLSKKQGLSSPIAVECLTGVTMEARTSLHEGYDDTSEDDGSESDFSEPSEMCSDWEELIEDIATDVQCLLDLDPLIEAPAPDITKRQTKQHTETRAAKWELFHVFSGNISQKFPKADIGLVDRLAKAHLDRILMTQIERAKHFQEAEQEKNQDDAKGVATGAITADPPPTELGSKFHDSGIGTSAGTGSKYAATVISFSSKGLESMDIPPLPEGAAEGKPFECVVCARPVVCRDIRLWRRHVFSDLRPWVCLDMGCYHGSQLFETHNKWIQHLVLVHSMEPLWQSFECPLCLEQTGNGKGTITSHLSGHMEGISLAALPADTEEDPDVADGIDRNRLRLLGEQPISEPRLLACPFSKRYPEVEWPRTCHKGFIRISRMKEHIYRRHVIVPHCKRCFKQFKTESDIESHLAEEGLCARTAPPNDMKFRVNKDTKKELISRRGCANLTEELKWHWVYNVLFPGEAAPDPFVPPGCLANSLAELEEFSRETLAQIQKHLNESYGQQLDPTSLEASTSRVVNNILEGAFNNILEGAFQNSLGLPNLSAQVKASRSKSP